MKYSYKRLLAPMLLLLLSAAIGGCGNVLLEEYHYGDEFPLQQGKQALVEGETLVRFLGVTQDSRCPTDAVCVWAGNAEVQLSVKVSGSPETRITLNTNQEFPTSAVVNGVTVELIRLDPERMTNDTVAQSDYVAHLVVRK